jgi:hypothetical protein
MAGLRPGHPRLGRSKKDVDARDKPGHDEELQRRKQKREHTP